MSIALVILFLFIIFIIIGLITYISCSYVVIDRPKS
jgi:hypothetical protein